MGSTAFIPRAIAGAPGTWNRFAHLLPLNEIYCRIFCRAIRRTNWPSQDLHQAAKLVRGLADKGDALCREIFRVQAHALGLFFDEMINTFDPDALIVGGGAIEASPEFQRWFIEEIRAGMPTQREEQAGIPIYVIPNGDTAGARGAAIEAFKLAKETGLI